MRLLLIEDEPTLRESVAKKLRRSGYEMDDCGDGETALELLAAERYDLVLLDLNLPKVNGMTVLRTLRKTDLETPVLILSARSEISDKVADFLNGIAAVAGMGGVILECYAVRGGVGNGIRPVVFRSYHIEIGKPFLLHFVAKVFPIAVVPVDIAVCNGVSHCQNPYRFCSVFCGNRCSCHTGCKGQHADAKSC